MPDLYLSKAVLRHRLHPTPAIGPREEDDRSEDGRCRFSFVAEAATRPPLPLQMAADAEGKRGCRPDPPST
jgi:hypothetical protein